MNKYVHVYTDEKGFYTACLKIDDTVLENLGGSYPKLNQLVLDAKTKWKGIPFDGENNSKPSDTEKLNLLIGILENQAQNWRLSEGRGAREALDALERFERI